MAQLKDVKYKVWGVLNRATLMPRPHRNTENRVLLNLCFRFSSAWHRSFHKLKNDFLVDVFVSKRDLSAIMLAAKMPKSYVKTMMSSPERKGKSSHTFVRCFYILRWKTYSASYWLDIVLRHFHLSFASSFLTIAACKCDKRNMEMQRENVE